MALYLVTTDKSVSASDNPKVALENPVHHGKETQFAE
jgi:hypothetical protein